MKFIYTDGSCLNNGYPNAAGGWGIAITDDNNNILEKYNGKLRIGTQTNNRAEMEAVYNALKIVNQRHDDEKYVIYSDSNIIVNGMKGLAKRKSNRDIWQDIETLCAKLRGRIYVDKVQGHVDSINIVVDKLAKEAAGSLI